MPDPVGTNRKTLKNPTKSQWLFIKEYMIDLNASEAAKRAGYSEANAGKVGPHLANLPHVRATIERLMEERTYKVEITQQRVLHELALLAFSDVNHYDIDDNGNIALRQGAPKHAMRAVSKIKRKVSVDKDGNVTREVELSLWDKPNPLRLAGKHVGLFWDKSPKEKEDAPTQINVNVGCLPPPEIEVNKPS
jgi:phage terminase small subunit